MASNTSKVVALSLAQLVTTVVTVVSGMVFTRYLSIADYATYLQTFLAYDFVSPLLTLGLPSALFYFLPRAEERQKGLVIDNMLLLFSLFLILGGTELLAQRFKNPKLNETLRWMIFFPLYTFPVVLGAILVVKDKVRLNAIYNIITGAVLTGAVILAAITTQHYDISSYFFATIIFSNNTLLIFQICSRTMGRSFYIFYGTNVEVCNSFRFCCNFRLFDNAVS